MKKLLAALPVFAALWFGLGTVGLHLDNSDVPQPVAGIVRAVDSVTSLDSADAHGWHWTKCRNHGRWIRGHQGVNWYGPFYDCGPYDWEAWEYYYTDKVWKMARR